MRAIVREAIAAGALGFATSKSPTHVGYAGKPVPSRLAELDEVRAIAGALGDAGRGVMQATLGRGLLLRMLPERRRSSRPTAAAPAWPGPPGGWPGPPGDRPG